MLAFHPRAEDLPAEFPVFPLPGALLLPRGKLPLNIFEPRYMAMVEDALGAGRMFGMVQPDLHGTEGPAGHALYRIGCLGRLSAFSETDDGRYVITLTGVARFTVDRELPMRRGYRLVRADFSAWLADLDVSSHPLPVGREPLLNALRSYFATRNIDANWDAIRRIPDDALVVTLCLVCPFEPVEKQALLEAAETDRGVTLLTLLQMGAASPGNQAGIVAS